MLVNFGLNFLSATFSPEERSAAEKSFNELLNNPARQAPFVKRLDDLYQGGTIRVVALVRV